MSTRLVSKYVWFLLIFLLGNLPVYFYFIKKIIQVLFLFQEIKIERNDYVVGHFMNTKKTTFFC